MSLDSLPRGSGQLLIVDDDVAVLEVTGKLLELVGYTALRAPDAEAAFELLRRNAGVRLVLLDLTLPGIEGADVIRQIRVIMGQTPIIVMTGYPEVELETRLQDQVIEGYIEKPFQPQKLLELVASVLSSTPV